MGEKAKVEKDQAVAAPAQQRWMPASFDDMDRLFEGLFQRGWPSLFQGAWPRWSAMPMPFEGRVPQVDVIERDGEVVVRAAVPGVDKKDLDVSVTDVAVTIKGETSHDKKEEKGDYSRCEMSRGSFSRTVALPAEVDGTRAKASFRDGVLELVIPKTGKATRRSVKID